MISIKKNKTEFIKELNQYNVITRGYALEFIEDLNDAINNKYPVEFLYYSIDENEDIFYKGYLVDIYVSDCIFSKLSKFILFELKVEGKSFLVPSPPLKENTIEYNNNSNYAFTKYYMLDNLIQKYAEQLDPRLTVKIIKNN